MGAGMSWTQQDLVDCIGIIASSHDSALAVVHAGGRMVGECEETGIGYKWDSAGLGELDGHHPSDGDKCQQYEMAVKHDPHMSGHYWLTDVCQQAIEIVTSKSGPSSTYSSSNLMLHSDKYSDVGSCM